MTITISVHLSADSVITAHDDRDGGYLTIIPSARGADRIDLFLGQLPRDYDQLVTAHRQLDAIDLAVRVARANLLDRIGRREDDPTETDEPTDEPAHPWAVAPGTPAEWVWHKLGDPERPTVENARQVAAALSALPPTEARAADGDR